MAGPTPEQLSELSTSRIVGANRLRKLWGRKKGECTWCGDAVPAGRRTWCSQSCVDQWGVRFDSGYARRIVKGRDRGVCGACGLPTERLQAILESLHRERTVESKALLDFFRSRLGAGFNIPHQHLWEADHIHEVIEGGAALGLENLQTLCIWCHKKKTAELARRRAASRSRTPYLDSLYPPETAEQKLRRAQAAHRLSQL